SWKLYQLAAAQEHVIELKQQLSQKDQSQPTHNEESVYSFDDERAFCTLLGCSIEEGSAASVPEGFYFAGRLLVTASGRLLPVVIGRYGSDAASRDRQQSTQSGQLGTAG